MNNYIKQAWMHLRQSPVASIISMIGTALAIFFIMIIVMLQQVSIVPFVPESNRDRFLYADYINFSTDKNASNVCCGTMSEAAAKELYQSLKTPEAVSIYVKSCSSSVISVSGITPFVVDAKQTDDIFWQVFDFDFTSGKPYDKAIFNSRQHFAVISESVARRLFGNTNATGKEVNINYSLYRVSGVVKDVSTLAPSAYAQIWLPYSVTNTRSMDYQIAGGIFSVVILEHKQNDLPKIKAEVDRKLAVYNKKLKEKAIKIRSMGCPYNQLSQSTNPGSNETPNLSAYYNRQLIIILILLLVPAFNLSSMTQSRLRRRTVEIGVRRAFGCTRWELLRNIVMENFILSLFAGAIGLMFCIAFAYFGTDLLFAQPWSSTIGRPSVNASMLLKASTFIYAFVFCFILNLLSSIIPAWRTSQTNIVNALNGRSH